MRKVPGLAILLLLCLTVRPTEAAQARPHAGRAGGRAELRQLLMRHYDGDRDGALSQQEWDRLRSDVQRADRGEARRAPRRRRRPARRCVPRVPARVPAPPLVGSRNAVQARGAAVRAALAAPANSAGAVGDPRISR